MEAMAIGFFLFVCTACSKDDCVYCGVDVSGGVRYGTDTAGIPKDQDMSFSGASIGDNDSPTADHDMLGNDGDGLSDEITDEDVIFPVENMVSIEGTTFMMGCEEGVAPNCAETKATPYHEVTVKGFEIDVYEVTKKDFEACIKAKVCTNAQGSPLQYIAYDEEHPFCVVGSSLDDSLPVNCVSWYGARTYCAWVGKRLPTEAEWELAARGTDKRWYPWGNAPGPSCYNTVMKGNSDWGCDNGFAMSVGSKPNGKSPYGLYDMAGNVWEWVEDDWHEDYTGAPTDGSAWVDATRPANRVIRGGSFMVGSEELFQLTTYGHYGAAAEDASVSRGFRCAR